MPVAAHESTNALSCALDTKKYMPGSVTLVQNSLPRLMSGFFYNYKLLLLTVW
ncbi:hypothetical protein KL86SPO_30310 [uncultured Sporomusa sp.]|uniref:Uncharacterized protein n=1 Tax=uncultured Sporomusa sp. TaxID=307249 RepID=A0A212LRH0_9FIRM|nr:hypothetical protein KL86SPO_30310 [uncultured Sporomusa sp.]